MSAPQSLQWRLALGIGLVVTLLWLVAAGLTARLLTHEMDEIFDTSLQETAQRLLPLAVMEILGREDDNFSPRMATTRDHDEYFTYVIRDSSGLVQMQSHTAELEVFPLAPEEGFSQTATHRLYSESALQGSLLITMAEPLDHRREVARNMLMALGLPILVVIPLSLAAILAAVRVNLLPLRRLRRELGRKGARDLSPLPLAGLPVEVAPVATAMNQLLARLLQAFEAERSFAANAAHELRTPLAGAIAQAQRLQAETADPAAAARAQDIESGLKRLTRLSEKLMQMARAEGGRLRMAEAQDLVPILRIVAQEFERGGAALDLNLPHSPVMSDLDPDALGIVLRNLLENALKYGTAGVPVQVSLQADGWLRVANAGPVIRADVLSRLTTRFERGPHDPQAPQQGSGLGLAIVSTLADRIGAQLHLSSPRPGQQDGLEVALWLMGPSDPA